MFVVFHFPSEIGFPKDIVHNWTVPNINHQAVGVLVVTVYAHLNDPCVLIISQVTWTLHSICAKTREWCV